jgi:DNA polymerase-1
MPFRHENPGTVGNYDLRRFLRPLQEIVSNRVCIFHNAKFDLVSLSTLGLDMGRTEFLCTMKLAHLVADHIFTLKVKAYSLDACCQHFLGRPGKKKSELFEKFLKITGWAGMPPEVHGEYAAFDTYSTLELFEALQPLLSEENLRPVWTKKADFIRAVIDMERNGVLVDQDFCDAMAEEGLIRQTEIRDVWKARFGKELNPMSRKDQEFLLIDTMRLPRVYHPKTGKPTFDKDAMLQYEEVLKMINSPLAGEILEYRGWNKAVPSNYLSYLSHLSPDGRLRPDYWVCGTSTGRLSCREPNLQQIPKRGEKSWNGQMKKCFVPEEDYELWEFDYSQLEFRLQAATAREQVLLEAFNDPDPTRDVFTEMADALKWERQKLKTFVYSTSYGAGKDRISFVFGVSHEEARRHIEQFYERYPNLRRASRIAKREVERRGKIELWSGRYGHFSFPQSESHKAFNKYTQGGAADIVEDTMVRCVKNGLNDGKRSRMLLQIHDSLLFEIHKSDVADAKMEIQSTMSNVVPDFGVVFKAEGKRWGA